MGKSLRFSSEEIVENLKQSGFYLDRHPIDAVGQVDVEKSAKPLALLKRYSTKPDDDDNYCGHCKKFNHHEGGIVKFDNGQIASIGWMCAEDVFKEDWPVIVREWENKLYEHINRKFIEPTKEAIKAGIAYCRTANSFAKKHEEFFLEMKDRMPNLFERLNTIANQNGQWTRLKKKKTNVVGLEGQQKEKIEIIEETVFMISGYSTIGKRPTAKLLQAHKLFVKAASFLEKENIKDDEITEARSLAKAALIEIEEAHGTLLSFTKFLTKENFQNIATAATQDANLHGRFYASNTSLRRLISGEKSEVAIPYNFSIIEFPQIRNLITNPSAQT